MLVVCTGKHLQAGFVHQVTGLPMPNSGDDVLAGLSAPVAIAAHSFVAPSHALAPLAHIVAVTRLAGALTGHVVAIALAGPLTLHVAAVTTFRIIAVAALHVVAVALVGPLALHVVAITTFHIIAVPALHVVAVAGLAHSLASAAGIMVAHLAGTHAAAAALRRALRMADCGRCREQAGCGYERKKLGVHQGVSLWIPQWVGVPAK